MEKIITNGFGNVIDFSLAVSKNVLKKYLYVSILLRYSVVEYNKMRISG